MVEISELDVDGFSARYTQIQFPYILLSNLNDTTPLVITLLEQGSMSVVGELDGIRKEIGHVSLSAYNVEKLVRTHGSVIYVKSGEESYFIKSVAEYMEVV